MPVSERDAMTVNDISLPLDLRLKDLMTPKAHCLEVGSTLYDAINKIHKLNRVEALVVVDKNQKPLGAISKNNILSVLARGIDMSAKIDSFYNPYVWCVNENITMKELTKAIVTSPYGFGIVTNDAGEVTGILTKVDSIMAFYKKSEILLAQMNTLYNAMYNAIAVTNKSGRIVSINKSAESIFSCKADEIDNMDFTLIAPSLGAIVKRVIETGEKTVAEKLVIDGNPYYANVACIIEHDAIIGTISVLQEIKDLESIAEELDSYKKLSKTLETVLNVAYDGIGVVDDRGVVGFVNEAFSNFINKNEEEIIGRHITEFLPDCKLHDVAVSGRPLRNIVSKYYDNNYVISCIPIFKNEKSVGAVGKISFRNLNEIKELAAKIELMSNKISYYKRELQMSKSFDSIITQNQWMQETIELAKKAAKTDSTIIVYGESGTGKEMFAQAIHANSSRCYGPFITVNCAAIPENLLESELFGYDDGAFTGARKQGKPGKFELAHKGTIFLDEIGDMPALLQAKLLRVLQDKRYERLGGIKQKEADVRILAATNKNLSDLVQAGSFREDLYYRINVIELNIPPLRERDGDIPLLIAKFIDEYNNILNKSVIDISPEALLVLTEYDWPGNVRELKHTLERAMAFCCERYIEVTDLPEIFLRSGAGNRTFLNNLASDKLYDKRNTTERGIILSALKDSKWNKTKAAEKLGISRAWLHQKIKQYNL